MSGHSSFVTLFTNTMKLPLVGGMGSSATAADERPALTAFAALVRAREVAASKRTLSHVSWLPDVLRIRGSIIPDIIGPVLTVTLFGLAVAAGTRYYDLPLRLSNGVVPLLSVVVGLLLVFRNTSAYERYSEGRKDFTLLLSASRNLSRLVWILVSLPPPPQQDGGKRVSGGPKEEMTREALTKEKIRFLKLVNAFVISVKHHLRGESGTDYQDYFGVLPSDFHRFDDLGSTFVSLKPNAFPPHASDKATPPAAPATTKGDNNAELASLASSSSVPSPSELEGQTSPHQKKKKKNAGEGGKKIAAGLKVAAHAIFPSNDIGKNEPGGGGSRPDLEANERTHLMHHHARRRTSAINVTYRPYESQGAPSLPLPLVIAHDLSRSIYRFRAQGTLDLAGPAGVNSMQNLIQTMIDQMGAMERVVRTPLPPVFGVHLKQCVSLYLFSLPLVLVDDMGWLMIPIVTLVSFTLMGIEGIASQVEQPFGQDDNDLPLDVETAELRVEIEYMINRLPEGQDDDDVFAV